jgi:hypothetical protein
MSKFFKRLSRAFKPTKGFSAFTPFTPPGTPDPISKSLGKSRVIRNSKLLSGRVREDGTIDIKATLDDRLAGNVSGGVQSVANEKEKKVGKALAEQQQQAAAAAAAAAEEEEPFTKAKESQLLALKRKGRRASILTSSQGASDPLGISG